MPAEPRWSGHVIYNGDTWFTFSKHMKLMIYSYYGAHFGFCIMEVLMVAEILQNLGCREWLKWGNLLDGWINFLSTRPIFWPSTVGNHWYRWQEIPWLNLSFVWYIYVYLTSVVLDAAASVQFASTSLEVMTHMTDCFETIIWRNTETTYVLRRGF